MRKNISINKNCYGCGVCVKACPLHIINLKETDKGFYAPKIIEPDRCISCGLCLDACSFADDYKPASMPLKSYAGWSRNKDVRYSCSSGGVGFELGRKAIEEGFTAIGVRYDTASRRASHFIATDSQTFLQSAGSKYIQSNTQEALQQIDFKQKYIFFGTPCQVSSMRRLLHRLKVENNFLLVDFFCHGTPSLRMWDKYLKWFKSKCPDAKSVAWRNKAAGWHDSWVMSASKSKRKYTAADTYDFTSNLHHGDMFYAMFLGNNCLNKPCYKHCKFKRENSDADIRIGDLWGSNYSGNEAGVSGVVAMTEKGVRFLNEISAIELKEESFEVVTQGQMAHGATKTYLYYIDSLLLRTPLSLKAIVKTNNFLPQIAGPLLYLKGMICNFGRH